MLPSADRILVVDHRLVVRAEAAFDNLKAVVLENVGPKAPTTISVARTSCRRGGSLSQGAVVSAQKIEDQKIAAVALVAAHR